MTTKCQNPSGRRGRMGDDLIVKFVLTILCSLMFLWGQMAVVAAPVPCAGQPMRHCCHGGNMPCCAARPVSASQPVSAMPAPAPAQSQISLPASSLITWLLPEPEAGGFSSSAVSPLARTGPPLRTRFCTLLI